MMYPERIQNAIEAALRHRAKLDSLLDQLETHYERGLDAVTPESASDYMRIQSAIQMHRKQCDHLHKIIGQWIVDDVAGTGHEY